ncbi:pre-mRNA-splicing factor cwc22 [Entomophthora muscae]|uniref:Pre-mRNA-splicing factor cwc22 n=1 Tax=Entomophthora muscae TaxID=34485 RepID=A0ACC2U784_9FUNG|nr:pre-mRNA-splicing factor cwc22 [Entomophthora muscae]
MQQQMIAEAAPDSEQVQRITWDALKKNLVRGRGLFCRSLMKAQSLALPFTPVYAALVAVINTKLPEIGELLISRVIYQFRRSYRRNDRPQCLALLTLLAHLVNQQVVHEILALQVLALLLERPTADSVELAVGLARESGHYLEEAAPRAFHAVFDRFRDILHQADIDKRVQYMVEVLFQVRKDKFKDNPAIDPELDLVDDDDRILHEIGLEDDCDPEEMLGIFRVDPDYLKNQERFLAVRKEILGSDEEGEEDDSEEEESSDEEPTAQQGLEIIDKTGTNLVNLRRTIYLTVMSSVDFQECAHKLMKLKIQESDEVEMCTMIVECCSQERTYTKFYGLLGERLCLLDLKWAQHFEHVFAETYETIHRYETNRLRSVARFFGHLFAGDGLPWPALALIRLTEDATTASSRIFVKILLRELQEFMGIKALHAKLNDPEIFPAIQPGLFPTDNPKNTRFAINYYTSVGLGPLTDGLRQSLQQAADQAAAARALRGQSSSDSSSASSSSSDSDFDSSSASDSDSGSSDSSSRSASPIRQPQMHPSRASRAQVNRQSPRSTRASRNMSPSPRSRQRRPPSRSSPSRHRSRSRSLSSSRLPRRDPSPRNRQRSPVRGGFSNMKLARDPSRSLSPKTRVVSRSVSPKRRRPSRSVSPRKRRSSRSVSPRKRRSSRSVSPKRRVSSRSPAGRRQTDRSQHRIASPVTQRRRSDIVCSPDYRRADRARPHSPTSFKTKRSRSPVRNRSQEGASRSPVRTTRRVMSRSPTRTRQRRPISRSPSPPRR